MAIETDANPTLTEEQREQSLDRIHRRKPRYQARPPRAERAFAGLRFGSLEGEELASIFAEVDRGIMHRAADLAQFMAEDAEIAGLYDGRISRVLQADWITAPGEAAEGQDASIAEIAADFCSEAIMARIKGWAKSQRDIMHAELLGYSVQDMDWQRDGGSRYWYINKLRYLHPRRFRYDEHWQLRLYDRGTRSGRDGQGQVLDPRRYVIHQFPITSGYPSHYGLWRASAYPWMFMRWTDKSFALFVDKYGHPMVEATVGPNVRQNVSDRIHRDLENMSYDHIFVKEEGVEIEVDWGGPDKNADVHTNFLAYQRQKLTRLWLGTSDANEVGPNGSRGATETRVGAFTDPKMVTDGDLLSATIERDIYGSALQLNAHKIGVPFDKIPIPTHRLKTADDEVRKDEGDAQEERQEEAESGERESITVQGPAEGEIDEAPPRSDVGSNAEESVVQSADKVQDLALNGAQVSSMLEIITKVASGELERDNAIEIIIVAFPTIEREQAGRIVPDKVTAPAVNVAPPTNTAPSAQGDVAEFMAEQRKAVGSFVKAYDLYAAYTDWSDDPVSQQAFGRSVKALGYSAGRKNIGRVYYGVRLS